MRAVIGFAGALGLGIALAAGCRISLDHATPDASGTGRRCQVVTNVQQCVDAASHSDLPWIQDNIFSGKCTISSACHSGKRPDIPLDLSTLDTSYAGLVGHASDVDKSRTLVVPGDAAKSYMMVMMGAIEPDQADPPAAPVPSNIGLMPQGSTPVCCQKLDAIQRWIEAGAPKM